MPEVPNDQAPTQEEQQLSSEANPNIEPVNQSVSTPEAPVAPQETAEALPKEQESEESEYKDGQVYNFVDPQGQGYSIVIQKVEGEKLTILNQTVPGAEPAEISLEDAKNMFLNGKLAQ